MLPKEEIESNLPQFTGTDGYYKIAPFSKLVISDGVKYLADSCDCYWLLMILVSVQNMKEIRGQEMQVLKFALKDKLVRVEDGNGKLLYKQKIGYTDFPLDEITVWLQNGVIYLPSEH